MVLYFFLNVHPVRRIALLSSRYAGARWSLRKPEFRVNLGAQVLGTALNSLRFDIGIVHVRSLTIIVIILYEFLRK